MRAEHEGLCRCFLLFQVPLYQRTMDMCIPYINKKTTFMSTVQHSAFRPLQLRYECLLTTTDT